MARRARRDGEPAAGTANAAPLPWGVALLLIAALSGGLWLAIFRLAAALF